MIKDLTINEREEKILKFWDKNKIFEKSLKQTEKNKPYIFYDGPPFATGNPHYGHLLGSVIKDVYGRFWTMNGRYVRRVWGWDCHGLPIENIAEKGLKINSKDEIEKIGVKKFNNYCRSKVLGYSEEWEKVIRRIGRWVDMDSPYKTMDNSYIESVWWAFSELWKKGYIYEGEKILMYCPRCSTPLAKAEIAMDNSYKKITEDTVVVKFKLKDEEVYALSWTTTPWTLPSNLALAVNPNLEYVYLKDKSNKTTYLLAKDLISKFFKEKNDYKIVKEVKGKELEGLEFCPLFPYFKNTKNAFKFVLGDFVSSEEGTGIVHTAPAFGEDDYDVCKKYKIPLVQPVDEKGNFTEEVSDFKGEFIHHTNKRIIELLKEQEKVVLVKKISHEYPFCYRCDTKLLYRAIPAWFVNIQKIKPKLLKFNKKIDWHPDFLKDGRVKHSIETAPDWNISRNRYWASAIPIWENEEGDRIVIGSIEELKKYAKNMPKGEIDLHKDYLDKIIFEKNGKEYRRVPEVMDCWFESGAMPFAQFHYPFENKEFFEKNFPSQFVAEYIAQIRTWFYYMNVLSAILFDNIPFENVVTTGTILAKDGQKMSKSKNNFTDPMDLIEKYGVDAIRFYFAGGQVMNAQDINFSDETVEEIYKKVISMIYNVNNFYRLYPKIKESKSESKNIMDKWIISKTNNLIKEVTSNLKDYNTIKTCAELRIFIDDLSTWYVRTSRDRFNLEDSDAKTTLKYVLENLGRLIAPITPFAAEEIQKTMGDKNSSIHLKDWPKSDSKKINKKLEENMQIAREIVSEGLRIRDKEQIGLKWPLSSAKISSPVKLDKDLNNIIKSQLNVKEIEYKKGKEISVTLDTKLTPELEAEGFAREISRKIQAERKNAKLVKKDSINLEIVSEFNSKIKRHMESIKEKVGAKFISFENSKKKFNHSKEGKIKSQNYVIKFSKI